MSENERREPGETPTEVNMTSEFLSMGQSGFRDHIQELRKDNPNLQILIETAGLNPQQQNFLDSLRKSDSRIIVK